MLTELQVFNQEFLDLDTKKLLDNQELEVKRMKGLVDNFLWMSLIESGNMRTRKSKIDLAEMVLELSEGFRKQLAINHQSSELIFRLWMAISLYLQIKIKWKLLLKFDIQFNKIRRNQYNNRH